MSSHDVLGSRQFGTWAFHFFFRFSDRVFEAVQSLLDVVPHHIEIEPTRHAGPAISTSSIYG